MINSNDLDKKAVLLGKLMGVLADADGISVNPEWFRHPVDHIAGGSGIGGVQTRLHDLVALIDSLLGPAAADHPTVVEGAAWYPIPDTDNEDTTPFFLVAPKDAPASGQIGLGMSHQIAVDKLTIDSYIYLPLIGYSPSGATLLVDSSEHPMLVGVHVAATEPFTAGEVTFTALSIDGRIRLSGDTPDFTLTFHDLAGTHKPAIYTRLADLLDESVMSWLHEVMLRASYWLDLYVGSSSSTIGQVLVAARFLSVDDDGNYHLDLANLKGTPVEIAINFLFAGLDILSRLTIPLITLPGGGIYVQHRQKSGDYGLRIATRLSLTSGTSVEGKGPPEVELALGAWMADETDDSNWMSRITHDDTHRPGLSVFALRRDADGHLSFAPGFELTSVGVNIRGRGDAPLFDIHGYTLGGAQLRTYLSSDGWPFGFVIRLEELGFMLAPAFDDVQADNNPIAGSLIAAGNQQGSSSEAKSTTNPVFSAQAGYVHGHSPMLELYDPEGNAAETIWFPIQRRFGPVDCKKVGLKIAGVSDGAENPVLGIVFDGQVALGPLEIYLDELTVEAHLREISNVHGYGLDLQGMNVHVDSGDLEINAGMIKSARDGVISYDGQAMMKFRDTTIAALGSYTSLPEGGGTSLFIFAMMNKPIGGPSFFYVTGVSAGFGYNRRLELPAIDNVQSFPLVAGLSDPALIGGDNPTPTQALEKLRAVVPPSRGDYWLAAGVQFTTFGIINSNALLVVQFGNELIISVLGVSTLRQPQKGNPYVYAQLGIQVVFRPDRGELSASAVLAPGSFVLTPAARLTGGFAFHAWFDNNPDHPGDFVFTIGGYHPGFTPPDHYPLVPRVGINWPVSRSISIVGEAYFAITPSAMMAGGRLELTFSDGPLKAWLKAQADVILYWNPFYLIADVSISVGVSFRMHLLFVDVTISAEIGATFHLWGPPIGGSVRIDWYVISFTIGFGARPEIPDELSWEKFREMLPHKTEKIPAAAQHLRSHPHAGVASTTPHVARSLASDYATAPLASDPPAAAITTPAFLNITGNKGPQETRQLDGLTLWLVRPGHFRFTVGSAVPASTIVVEGHDASQDVTIAGRSVSMRRVNGGIGPDRYRSPQTVSIIRLKQNHHGVRDIMACMVTPTSTGRVPSGCQGSPIDITGWEIAAVEKNLPQAMWGAPITSGGAPTINGESTVTGTIGVTMSPRMRPITNCTPEMVIDDVFRDRVINREDAYRLPLSRDRKPSGNVPAEAPSFADIARIAEPAVKTRRIAVFEALQRLGANGWTNEEMSGMAAAPGLAFADEPMEGSPAVATHSATPSRSRA